MKFVVCFSLTKFIALLDILLDHTNFSFENYKNIKQNEFLVIKKENNRDQIKLNSCLILLKCKTIKIITEKG